MNFVFSHPGRLLLLWGLKSRAVGKPQPRPPNTRYAGVNTKAGRGPVLQTKENFRKRKGVALLFRVTKKKRARSF